ncbi:hypothetical protein KNE206_40990 [Kitasatospora sp. NE20-6]|uniref:GlcG/HbpS family heme-binding protein n=1 Tax=Kitasatospora sp. NE20-6 TaxID=2859066 RepID=UPI0034DB84F9
MTTLTSAAAEEIIEACLARGQEIGKAFSIAVVDAGGFVLSVRRSDGARPLTPDIARAKAFSAAVMQRPTKMLHPWAESNPVFFSQLSQMTTYPIVATEGGVTVKRDGEILGGLGVSGGTGDEDQQVCDDVLAALGYELEFDNWAGAKKADTKKAEK